MPAVMDKYEEQRARARARNRKLAEAGKEIGAIPPIANAKRFREGFQSFRRFCEIYFPETFYLEWSKDHLKAIRKIERAVTVGALFALAMPRGSGKSAMVRIAALWAVLTGRRRYVAIIGATSAKAQDELATIKTICESNQALADDYPAALHPIQKLERITQRQKGQTHNGQHTRIQWLSDKLVFPTIAGSKASGAVITAAGLQSEDIRGQNHQTVDGANIRPDLVLIDDPQTTESAWSQAQTVRRVSLLSGDVLGLAGPGRKIAGLMACTVIRPGDMADQILDRKKYPVWQGERTKLLYAFPSDTKRWEEYATILSDELQADGDGSIATEFYRQNQKAMDKGARPAWSERFNPDELSATQHAMNLKFRDEDAFQAEYQNDPQIDTGEAAHVLRPDDLATRNNGYKETEIPPDTTKLTAFVDVQKHCLYYLVAAWSQNFTGYVVDYGTFPEQTARYFTYRKIQRTLGRTFPGHGLEARIFQGLNQLAGFLFGDTWGAYKLDLCLVDANWGESRNTVYSACRQMPYRIFPSHGKWVGATARPLDQYTGPATTGPGWRIPPPPNPRETRHVVYDVNLWKSFTAQRLLTPIGDPGSLTFHKGRSHKMLIDHLTSETATRVEARGNVVTEWKLRPEKPDNHWFDCLVGSAVAASICGISTEDKKPPKRQVKKRKGPRRATYL